MKLLGIHPCKVGQYRVHFKRPILHAGRNPKLSKIRASGEDNNGDANKKESEGPQLDLLDPSQTVQWGGTVPSKRRFVLGVTTASFIALGGNLGGITSFLLGLDNGNIAGKLKLDTVVPVKGFKRCVDGNFGFEFQYPSFWLADQSLVRRAAERIEQQYGLDLPSIKKKRRPSVEPVAAYGPPGTIGEENVSVVVAPIAPGFKLVDLGSPKEAGQKLLDTVIAPEGSGKTAELITASERFDAIGQIYYTVEYTVRTSKWFRHNVSVYTSRNDMLFSFNAQCPQSAWSDDERILRRSADTFVTT